MCEHECDTPEFEFDTADGYAPANQYDKATGERLRTSWGENGWERRGEVKPFCNETAENCVADCHCGDGTCEAARGEGVLKPPPPRARDLAVGAHVAVGEDIRRMLHRECVVYAVKP